MERLRGAAAELRRLRTQVSRAFLMRREGGREGAERARHQRAERRSACQPPRVTAVSHHLGRTQTHTQLTSAAAEGGRKRPGERPASWCACIAMGHMQQHVAITGLHRRRVPAPAPGAAAAAAAAAETRTVLRLRLGSLPRDPLPTLPRDVWACEDGAAAAAAAALAMRTVPSCRLHGPGSAATTHGTARALVHWVAVPEAWRARRANRLAATAAPTAACALVYCPDGMPCVCVCACLCACTAPPRWSRGTKYRRRIGSDRAHSHLATSGRRALLMMRRARHDDAPCPPLISHGASITQPPRHR
eukprot:COSAG01_NODE_6188_length_3802_cov_12.619330_3_plen_304_part_00